MSNHVGSNMCCFSGKKSGGTPKGSYATIGGVECYVAKPAGEARPKSAIVICTDVFGESRCGSGGSSAGQLPQRRLCGPPRSWPARPHRGFEFRPV